MKLFLYTVHDRAVGAYLTPFYARSEQEAVRMLADTCRDQNHQFARNPGDYRLYALGHYEDQNATFGLLEAPAFVVSCDELVRRFELPLHQVEREAAG